VGRGEKLVTENTKTSKTRLSLDLSPAAAQRLQELRAKFEDNPSKTELIRRSLTLLEYMKDQVEKGNEFKLVTKNGTEVELPLLMLKSF
jgi:hypothetical protein